MMTVRRARWAIRLPGAVATALTIAAALVTGAAAQTGNSGCRQALALGLDVSGSVDAREYRLQINGIISALDAAPVRAALLALPDAPAELLIYEWSGVDDQHLILDWTAIRGPADIELVQEVLAQTTRRGTSPGTALGTALDTGWDHLDRRAQCWKRTLDISGDGVANLGPDPSRVRDRIAQTDITVNALVIGADAPGFGDLRQAEISELTSYFRTRVITGSDAFVQSALGYEGYAEAMARKLERELQGLVYSELHHGTVTRVTR